MRARQIASWGQIGSCLLSFSLCLRGDELAPPSESVNRPIERIQYVPELQPIGRADLARAVQVKVGQPLRMADVRATVKQLYRTGEYANVEIDATPDGAGVALTIRTTEQYFVGGVDVRGKESIPPNRGQIANASRLELGTPFSDQDLQTALARIRNLLQRNGFYLASVDPQIRRDPERQEVAFTFMVNPGKRARYTNPVVTGDTREPPEKVAKWAKYKAIIRWKRDTQQNSQAGVENIRKKYAKEERLTADVTLDRLDYLAENNRVRPNIKAEGGPKIKIETSGAKLSKSKLQEYVPVFDEGTVNRDLLVGGVRNLRDYFQNHGYFDVQIDFTNKDIDPDHQQIQYVIGLGARHKVV